MLGRLMNYRVPKWFKIIFIAGLVLSSPLFMLLAIDRVKFWKNYWSMPVRDIESVLYKVFEDYGPNQPFELADVIDQFDWQYVCTTEQYRRASHSVSRELNRDITRYKFLPRDYFTKENRGSVVFVDHRGKFAYVYPMLDNMRVAYWGSCWSSDNSHAYFYKDKESFYLDGRKDFDGYLMLSFGMPD